MNKYFVSIIMNLIIAINFCACRSKKNFIFSPQEESKKSSLEIQFKTTIAIGRGPYNGVITYDNKYLYVTNCLDNTVSVIDTLQNKVIKTIPVRLHPGCIVLRENETISIEFNLLKQNILEEKRYGYVGNIDNNSISIIDLKTNEEIQVIPNIYQPKWLAISKNNKYLYIALSHYTQNKIRILNLPENSYNSDISLDNKNCSEPHGFVLSSDEKYLYTANIKSHNVCIIDLFSKECQKVIPVGNNPWRIDKSTDDKYLFTTNSSSNTVSKIDISTFKVKTIEVGQKPYSVKVSPNNKYLYVSNAEDNTLSVIDLVQDKVIKEINVGITPHGIVVSSDNKYIYVINEGSNNITVLEVKE